MTEPRNKVYIIAEAGVNHNGDADLAIKLVDAAAAAGADAVKFQTFRADHMAAAAAPKAAYQIEATDANESQLEMLRRLELPPALHHHLVKRCDEKGIDFLSTPFDLESLDFLVNELDLRTLKIPSGAITNGPLLLAAARTGRDLILSTGMSTLNEVRDALGIFAFGYTAGDTAPSKQAFANALRSDAGRDSLDRHVTLLHCTTEYPAPVNDVNLRAMDTLAEYFSLKTGLSDHTPGITVAIAAAGRGARVIEKHFTLDRTLPGPDHRASIEPEMLSKMVEGIRQVETAIGDGIKQPAPSERKNIAIARDSLVALKPVKKGEVFNEDNLGVKRPGTGISAMEYWSWLGRAARRDFAADEIIEP
jgi:N-acetylneuraminate synthase